MRNNFQKVECNERLEFLGRQFSKLISSEFYFCRRRNAGRRIDEVRRAEIWCVNRLLLSVQEIDLGEYLILGKGEEATGGRKRDSLISDALEALIGLFILTVVLLMQKSLL